LTLEQTIRETEIELEAYKSANFANPQIIEWLESIVTHLKRLENEKE
jgi:hypothetical protein